MFIRNITCFLLSVSIVAPVQASDDRAATVALTATVAKGANPSQQDLTETLLALLEAEVSAQTNLVVVERRRIDLTLHELALSLDLGNNAEAKLRLGKIASADLIVTLELTPPEKEESPPRVLIRIVESLTGTIRGVSTALVEESQLAEACAQIARYLKIISTTPERSPVTVAVAPFESKGRFDRLRPLERGLRDMFVTRLRRWSDTIAAEKNEGSDSIRGFHVLQRSGMKELLSELELIQSGLVDADRLPQTLPTRAAAFLIRGELDEKNDDGKFSVIVSGELVHAASGKTVRNFRFETKPDGLEVALAHQVDLFAGRLADSAKEVSKNPGTLREIHEVDSLFESTLADLRRFRRRRPIDFSYRDFALGGKSSGPPVVKADSVLGRALLNKAIDRLEVVLFIQPDNMKAAYALGYCYGFQIDGIGQPERADSLLRKVGTAATSSKLRADGLRLLAEISFHHWQGQLEQKDRSTAAGQVVNGLVHMPEDQRDYMWVRITELLETTLPYSKDVKLAEDLLQFSRTQANRKEFPHRARFAAVAADAQTVLGRLRPGTMSEASLELHRHLEGQDLAMKEMAARKLAAEASRKKDYEKAAAVFRIAADALAESGTKTNQFKSNNLNMHAARCLRLAGQTAEARTLLESFQPVRATSLNAGYRAVQLGYCYMHDGENERALKLLVDSAEQCDGLVDNSEVTRLIAQLGGVPLRENREIDVEYINGPNETPIVSRVLATDGTTLFCAGGFRGGIAKGVLSFDPETGAWDTLNTQSGRVTDMVVHNQTLWAATENEGLWKYSLATDQWTSFTTEDGLPDNRISCLLATDNGTYVGLGTRGAGGVVHIDTAGTVTVLDGENSPTSVPYSLAVSDDRLIVTTQPSMHELDIRSGHWEAPASGIPRYTRVFQGKRHVWASKYRQELVPWSTSSEKTDSFKPAWFSGSGKAGYSVAFVIEHNGHIWFGGSPWERFLSSGFYRIDPETGEFRIYNPRDGFRISTTYETYDGVAIGDDLWIATSAGLAKVTPTLASE